MIGDLTTLSKVKIYLEIDAVDTAADRSLTQLISSQSRIFLSEIRRNILYQKYVEIRDGENNPGIETRQYPIQRVESVLVDGNPITQQPAFVAGQTPGYGWVISGDKGRIEIRSSESRLPFIPDDPGSLPSCVFFDGLSSSGTVTPIRFARGPGNVVLTYWAGYLCNEGNGEAATIPASAPYEIQALDNFYSDVGVMLADGVTALSKVSSSPVTGQYAVSSAGLYTFAAADASAGVLLNYAIVPIDIEQAIHWMIEYQRQGQGHVGQKSKEMGTGQVVSFMSDGYDPRAQSTINFYERKW